MPKPGVCVIIPNWNGQTRLARLLPLLWEQSRPPDEIVIVDNGSEDASIRIAGAIGARVIRLPRNMGFARAVNEGIRANEYDWIAVVNNDVVPRADWLERLLTAAQPEEYWFAASKLLDASDPKRLDGCYDEISRGGCAWHCGQGRKDGGIWNQPRRIRFTPLTASLFRAKLFDRVGLLDEGFESYLEDVDFGIRCALRGYSGVYAPDAVAAHEGSATLGKWHPDTVRRISRNQLLLVAKHFPRNWVWRYGWPVLAGQTLWGLLAARHGCGFAYFWGKIQGLRVLWRRAAPAPSSEAVADLLSGSEREIYRLQRTSGMDAYWKFYFALTRAALR
ncbi:MAG: glycosyltransferase family 2 protein [Bryobacteraceae bacterium]